MTLAATRTVRTCVLQTARGMTPSARICSASSVKKVNERSRPKGQGSSLPPSAMHAEGGGASEGMGGMSVEGGMSFGEGGTSVRVEYEWGWCGMFNGSGWCISSQVAC